MRKLKKSFASVRTTGEFMRSHEITKKDWRKREIMPDANHIKAALLHEIKSYCVVEEKKKSHLVKTVWDSPSHHWLSSTAHRGPCWCWAHEIVTYSPVRCPWAIAQEEDDVVKTVAVNEMMENHVVVSCHKPAITPPNHQLGVVFICHRVEFLHRCFLGGCWVSWRLSARKRRRLKLNGSWWSLSRQTLNGTFGSSWIYCDDIRCRRKRFVRRRRWNRSRKMRCHQNDYCLKPFPFHFATICLHW